MPDDAGAGDDVCNRRVVEVPSRLIETWMWPVGSRDVACWFFYEVQDG